MPTPEGILHLQGAVVCIIDAHCLVAVNAQAWSQPLTSSFLTIHRPWDAITILLMQKIHARMMQSRNSYDSHMGLTVAYGVQGRGASTLLREAYLEPLNGCEVRFDVQRVLRCVNDVILPAHISSPIRSAEDVYLS